MPTCVFTPRAYIVIPVIRRVRVRAARWLMGESPASAQELWSAVDSYICDRLLPQDPVLDAALAASDAAGLPPIASSAAQGKLLELIVRVHGAKRILELGALGGYGTIWLARGLPPDGQLVTLEYDPRNAEVARANIAAAGLSELVELRQGPALETLPALEAEGTPFDLIFIDADKENIPAYIGWALKLAKRGTLLVIDNVVREGAILNAASKDPDIQGVRAMFELLAAEPRLSATAIQTVGRKKWDGLALAVVVDTKAKA
jgi:predicted O-methyltransferase YrrM